MVAKGVETKTDCGFATCYALDEAAPSESSKASSRVMLVNIFIRAHVCLWTTPLAFQP